MAQKTHALQIVQIGNESTWGTVVAATKKLHGITSIEVVPLAEVSDFPSLEGLAPIYQSEIVRTGATATIESLVLYEDLPIWLDSLLQTDAAPTGADPYTYSYEAPTTSAPTRRFFTIQYGDSGTSYAMTGALVKSLSISGAAGEALTMTIEFVGHHVEADSIDSLSDRTTNIATAAQTELYIDATGGTEGTTNFDCEMFDFELTIDNMTAVTYQIGAITPCDYYQNRFDGSLNMTLEYAGDSSRVKTLIDNMLGTSPSQVERLIQLKASNTANLDIEINLGCVLMTAPSIWGDNDGVTTVELEWKLKHLSDIGASGNFVAIDVINGVSSQF